MEVLKALFSSKKFLTALGGTISSVLFVALAVPEETSLGIVGILIAYILGQSAVDVVKAKNNAATEETVNKRVQEALDKLQPKG